VIEGVKNGGEKIATKSRGDVRDRVSDVAADQLKQD
jgi:hypothetical protein